MSHLFRFYCHLLAKLVHQGYDPKLPYQALVIRKSVMLRVGFAPWGGSTFSAPRTANSGVIAPLTLLIVPRSPLTRISHQPYQNRKIFLNDPK